MRVFLGVQSRSNSKRLPNKIYELIGEKTILQWVHEAVEFAAQQLRIDGDSAEVYILGPKEDTKLRAYCLENKMQGLFPDCAENDLINRYLQVSEEFTHIVRITADCWCIHPEIIIETTRMLRDSKIHYISNTIIRSYQEGQDTQAFSRKALRWLSDNSTTDKAREHPWCDFDMNESMREKFKKEVGEVSQLLNRENELFVKTSIDTKEDLDIARKNYALWEKKIKAKTLGK
jgi:spore coat polysaccharide biosynthesis protein SpsF (cytidylyltransferase family)